MEKAPENFFEMVKTDPLFAAEGIDLERAEAALTGIEDIAQEYEEISSTHSSFFIRLWHLRYPIARSALPLPFLRSFLESERRRRRFLAYPSFEAGKDLLSAWSDTQRNLRTCVQNFSSLNRTLYRISLRNGKSEPLHDYCGRFTVWEDVEHQLDRLMENAQLLGQHIQERRAILEGQSVGTLVKGHARDTGVTKFVEAEIPEKYKKVHELELQHSLPYRHGTILERHGPLVFTLPHFNVMPAPHVFMAYIVRNDSTQIVSLKVTTVDEFKFRKTGVATDPWHIRSQSHLLGKGIPYWYQTATHLYTMRDQQYWADIATIIDLRRRPWLDAQLVRAQKSSLFDLLLGACLEDHEIVRGHLKENCRRGNYTLDMARLWSLVRTHPSIYFMPYNASVWRLAEPLSFLGSGLTSQEDVKYLSADIVLPTLSTSELELVMQAGRTREEARKREGDI